MKMNIEIKSLSQWILPVEANSQFKLFVQEPFFPSQTTYMLFPSKQKNRNPEARGGNNVSENLKKCLNCILKNHLSDYLLRRFEEQCILKNNLKSQKQLPIVYFLYLQKFLAQSMINSETLQTLARNFRNKIKLFIKNSQNKRQAEPERSMYHMKNIESFERYLQIDYCLQWISSFQDLSNQLQKLYTRKRSEFIKAKDRLRIIVEKDSFISTLFYDLNQRQLPQFCESLSLPDNFRFNDL